MSVVDARLVGLNTPSFAVKNSYNAATPYNTSRRLIMLRAIPGIGRFPLATEVEGGGTLNTRRVMSLNGVPTIGDIVAFD